MKIAVDWDQKNLYRVWHETLHTRAITDLTVERRQRYAERAVALEIEEKLLSEGFPRHLSNLLGFKVAEILAYRWLDRDTPRLTADETESVKIAMSVFGLEEAKSFRKNIFRGLELLEQNLFK